MGMAICLKCGAQKNRPLSACPGCRFDPQEPRDRAISTLLTDRYMEVPELIGAAKRIRSGELLEFDQDELQRLVAKMPTSARGRPADVRVAVAAPAGPMAEIPDREPLYAERLQRRSWVPGLVAAAIGLAALFALSVLRYFFLDPDIDAARRRPPRIRVVRPASGEPMRLRPERDAGPR